MTNAALLFVSTYVLVLALGLQSLNVNGGHYLAAFLTSFVIGATNMVLLKLGPDATTVEIAAYLAGGPLGIITAMWLHRRTIGRKTRPHNSARWLRPYQPPERPVCKRTDQP